MSAPRPSFGMFTTDTRLVVRTWDAFLAAVTGIPAEQALDRELGRLLPELEARGLLTIIQQVAGTGAVHVLAPALHRYLIACPPAAASSAELLLQRVTSGPVREEGQITGVAVTIEDVTARVEREKTLAARFADPAAAPREAPVDAEALTRALGAEEWRARRAAVHELSTR